MFALLENALKPISGASNNHTEMNIFEPCLRNGRAQKILLAAQDRFGVKIAGLVKSQAASQEGPYARRIQP
jgi:hypothetical protein